jgi:vacuolar-type H+-ATPase subunit I/STV1
MSETTIATANAGESTDQSSDFKAPSSQDELNRIVQARLDRERSKFADYDDLKAKASKLAEIEEANKTEAEKQAERFQQIERENQTLKQAKDRAEVAADKGLPANLLSGSTREELEASADALIAFRDAAATAAPSAPQSASFVIPGEGNSPALALNGDGIEAALKNALGIR